MVQNRTFGHAVSLARASSFGFVRPVQRHTTRISFVITANKYTLTMPQMKIMFPMEKSGSSVKAVRSGITLIVKLRMGYTI